MSGLAASSDAVGGGVGGGGGVGKSDESLLWKNYLGVGVWKVEFSPCVSGLAELKRKVGQKGKGSFLDSSTIQMCFYQPSTPVLGHVFPKLHESIINSSPNVAPLPFKFSLSLDVDLFEEKRLGDMSGGGAVKKIPVNAIHAQNVPLELNWFNERKRFFFF